MEVAVADHTKTYEQRYTGLSIEAPDRSLYTLFNQMVVSGIWNVKWHSAMSHISIC